MKVKKILGISLLVVPMVCSTIGFGVDSSINTRITSYSGNWWPAGFWQYEELDAKLIGGCKGTFTIYHKTGVFDECELVDISSSFLVNEDNYNFNNGEFVHDGFNYKITKFGIKAFSTSLNWYFINTHITFPDTIIDIADHAFDGNSCNTSWEEKEILGLNFNNNLENIGEGAFYKCNDLDSDILKLPNGLKHIGNDAFYKDHLKTIDLSDLDHVINVDCKPLSKSGCFSSNDIKKIYVKDQSIKNMYMSDKYWSSCSALFEIK